MRHLVAVSDIVYQHCASCPCRTYPVEGHDEYQVDHKWLNPPEIFMAQIGIGKRWKECGE
jgi:hypothetical protein